MAGPVIRAYDPHYKNETVTITMNFRNLKRGTLDGKHSKGRRVFGFFVIEKTLKAG